MVQYLEYIRKATVLIEALPYIQRFRGDIVLVKFGGSVLEEPTVFESALRDIVFLECIGAKPVIVHGGGKEISRALEEKSIKTRFVNGLRYTCEDSIHVVDEVLHELVNPKLVNAINKYGGRAEKVSGKDVLKAVKINSEEDLGYVGEVASVDVAPILKILDKDIVPVITPLGIDESGHPYNINADISACKIAQALQESGHNVAKLVFLSDVPGILEDQDDDDSLIKSIRLRDVPDYIEKGVISGGMVPKIQSATEAIQSGCEKVHMIDARLQHSLLLEIFTDSGVGTQILKDPES